MKLVEIVDGALFKLGRLSLQAAKSTVSSADAT
jgi:hypothetical protein